MQKSPLQYGKIPFQYWETNEVFGVHLISPCFAAQSFKIN